MKPTPALKLFFFRSVLRLGCRCTAFHRVAWNANSFLGGVASPHALDAAIPNIRNIGIVAHIDAGKTTTTERMLFYAGVVKHIGEVDSGTTTTDFMKEEMDRGITIQSAAVSLLWKGCDIHLIDTPGHVDFTVEVERALRVVDGVVALFDASVGMQAQSYTVLQQSHKFGIPVLAFLNKMDKFNADYDRAVGSIRDKLQIEPLLLQVPLHAADGEFEGVVDVIGMRSYRFVGNHGKEVVVGDLQCDASSEHATVVEASKTARHQLIAQLTRLDDDLSERLIHELDVSKGDEKVAEARLTPDELRATVRRLTLSPQCLRVPVIPVLCGASRRDQGVQPLLDAINFYLPSPLDRKVTGFTKANVPIGLPLATAQSTVHTVALAFKVMHVMSPERKREPLVFIRVYSGCITPRTRLRNCTRNCDEVPRKLYVMHANTPVEVSYLGAGAIGAAFLEHTYTGDTLVAPPARYIRHAKLHLEPEKETEVVHTLEGIHPPPPVISFSIEAETKRQVALLDGALSELSREDPSLRVSRDNFGNAVVSGMGELHLDIVLSRLKHEYQIHCRLLRAVIEYREGVKEPQSLEGVMGMHNGLPYAMCSLALQPLWGNGEDIFNADAHCQFKIDPNLTETYTAGETGSAAQHARGNRVGRMSHLNHVHNAKAELAMLEQCFQAAVTACVGLGPLAGLPMHGFEVVLTTFRKVSGVQLQEKPLAQVARSLVLQLIQRTPKRELVLLEPMMEVEVHLSEAAYLGKVVSSLNEHRAVTVDLLEDGRSVRAIVALRNIVRYTMELRKEVKGHANFFTKLAHYRVVGEKAVMARIFKNLGIAE